MIRLTSIGHRDASSSLVKWRTQKPENDEVFFSLRRRRAGTIVDKCRIVLIWLLHDTFLLRGVSWDCRNCWDVWAVYISLIFRHVADAARYHLPISHRTVMDIVQKCVVVHEAYDNDIPYEESFVGQNCDSPPSESCRGSHSLADIFSMRIRRWIFSRDGK